MDYLSIKFVIFVVCLLTVFHSISFFSKGRRNPHWLLLVGNIIFYCSFGWKNLIFLCFTVISTFYCAQILTKSRHKKFFFIGCIMLNAFIWFTFKILLWNLDVIQYLGINLFVFPEDSVFVPIGISYFTLMALGYLIDVYTNKIQPERSLWKYFTFISYFPGIVQGPISRYETLSAQLFHHKTPSIEAMRKGLLCVLFGLVKKLVITNRIAPIVSMIFSKHQSLGGIILYGGMIGYSIQLYADFSGCVDICRGVSFLFNIEMPHNFERPYLATSIKQFWRNWHMTLSSWLRDYVYIPLGGSRKGKIRGYINILFTFIVSGIWHGAGAHFIIWGMLHACYQIIGHYTLNVRTKIKSVLGIRENSFSDRIYQTIITFHLVAFAWIFFWIDDLQIASRYIKRMFTVSGLHTFFDGPLSAIGLNGTVLAVLLFNIIIWFAIEVFSKRQENVVNGVLNCHLFLRWGIYLLLIFNVILFGAYGPGYSLSSFMYGGF